MKPNSGSMPGRWSAAQLLRSVEEDHHLDRRTRMGFPELSPGSRPDFFETGLPIPLGMEFPYGNDSRTSRGFPSMGSSSRGPSQIMRARRAMVAAAAAEASNASAADEGEASEAGSPDGTEVFHDCMDLEEENAAFSNIFDDLGLEGSERLPPQTLRNDRMSGAYMHQEAAAGEEAIAMYNNSSSRGTSCKRKSCNMRSSSPVLGSDANGIYPQEVEGGIDFSASRRQLLMGHSSAGASSSRSPGLSEGPRPQKTRLSTDVLESSLFLRPSDNIGSSSSGAEFRLEEPPLQIYPRSVRRAIPESLRSRRSVPTDFEQVNPDLSVPFSAHFGPGHLAGVPHQRTGGGPDTSLAILRSMRTQSQRIHGVPPGISRRIARASAIHSTRGLAAGPSSSSSSVPVVSQGEQAESRRATCLDPSLVNSHGSSVRRGAANYLPGLGARRASVMEQQRQPQQPQQPRASFFSRPSAAGTAASSPMTYPHMSQTETPEMRLHSTLFDGVGSRGFRPPVLPAGRRELGTGEGVDWERHRPRLMVGGIAEILRALERVERDEDLTREQLLMLEATTFLFGGIGIHDDHNDWRLDIDNMSYEELLALGDRIGTVSTGVSEEVITRKMKKSMFCHGSSTRSLEDYDTKCCVCQEEYESGVELGIIDCGHSYHTGCIRQWLVRKNSCPICKATALSIDGDEQQV